MIVSAQVTKINWASKGPASSSSAAASTLAVATGVSFVTQLTGAQTALRGMTTAACLWFAFVLTTWATEYGFELRPYSQLGINGGFWLLGMLAMGAIVGAWKH